MPRGRSSSRSSRSSGFSSRSSSRSASPPPQQTRPPMQAPQQRSGGMMGGLGSTIMTGMAFGAGSEVAHQAVRSVTGGGSREQQPEQSQSNQTQTQPQQQANYQPQQQNPCLEFNTKFVDCLKRENNDISSCQSLFDELKTCEKNLFR